MSTPDQPSPPLTRRQLRELRNTASTPIITPEEAEAAAETPAPPAPSPPLPRAADPVQLPEAPSSDVDLDEHPSTRRRARQQAKLRTASVGIIPLDSGTDPEPVEETAVQSEADADATDEAPEAEIAEAAEQDTPDPEVLEGEPADSQDADADAPADVAADPEKKVDDSTDPAEGVLEGPAADSLDEQEREREDAPVVAPSLGAQLLEGGGADVDLPPSFDHLLTRGGSGSSSAPNALILSQTPDTDSLSVPILGTGELIITGSYNLPDSYGSTGTTPGTSDGKDIDAALVDGELPPASSPTPIAASSAISTIKSADEIIRPPAPEKGSRLIMTLAICAGALGLALVTVLILAVTNGVF